MGLVLSRCVDLMKRHSVRIGGNLEPGSRLCYSFGVLEYESIVKSVLGLLDSGNVSVD